MRVVRNILLPEPINVSFSQRFKLIGLGCEIKSEFKPCFKVVVAACRVIIGSRERL